MKSRKLVILTVVFLMFAVSALSAQNKSNESAKVLEQYYGQSFHGSMMGKIITADITIVDDEIIEFTANLPAGKKHHTYNYKIISESENGILTEWYENGKLDRTVTFSVFGDSAFTMEVKGKGKVKMQLQ